MVILSYKIYSFFVAKFSCSQETQKRHIIVSFTLDITEEKALSPCVQNVAVSLFVEIFFF